MTITLAVQSAFVAQDAVLSKLLPLNTAAQDGQQIIVSNEAEW